MTHTNISMEKGLEWLESVCEHGIPEQVINVIQKYLEVKQESVKIEE